MQFIKGYFYQTEAQALIKINEINQGEKIPQPGASTETYCEPLRCVGGFYLPFDEVTQKYLGVPSDIELQANQKDRFI